MTFNHGAWVRTLAWCGEGARLASSGDDGQVRLWDLETCEPRLTLEHGGFVPALEWCGEGVGLASGGDDGRVCLWEVRTIETGRSRKLCQFTSSGSVQSLAAFTLRSRSLLAAGLGDGRIVVWEVEGMSSCADSNTAQAQK